LEQEPPGEESDAQQVPIHDEQPADLRIDAKSAGSHDVRSWSDHDVIGRAAVIERTFGPGTTAQAHRDLGTRGSVSRSSTMGGSFWKTAPSLFQVAKLVDVSSRLHLNSGVAFVPGRRFRCRKEIGSSATHGSWKSSPAPEYWTPEVAAFVDQARQFCDFIEKASSFSLEKRLTSARQRLLELYERGSALPHVEPPEGIEAGPSPEPPVG
jgi:hypothetical protein